MSTLKHATVVLVVMFFALAFTGCAGRFLHGDLVHSDSKIRSTPDNSDIMELMQAYKNALESLDVDTLRSLISFDYYENAGTTNTTDDDYGYEGLDDLFTSLRKHVKEARVNVIVRDIRVYDDRADVIFEYAYTMLYKVGDEKRWQTERDINRFQLHRDNHVWRIVSGL